MHGRDMFVGESTRKTSGKCNGVDFAAQEFEWYREIVGKTLGSQRSDDVGLRIRRVIGEMAAKRQSGFHDPSNGALQKFRCMQDGMRSFNDTYGFSRFPHEPSSHDVRMQRANECPCAFERDA